MFNNRLAESSEFCTNLYNNLISAEGKEKSCGPKHIRKQENIKCVSETHVTAVLVPVAYPGIFFGGVGSINSVEDGGQRERGSGSGSQLIWRQL